MKKFDWKEFGLEFLGGLVELLIMLGILALGGVLLWLLPDSWANALGNDLEIAGLIVISIVLVIVFIIRKNQKVMLAIMHFLTTMLVILACIRQQTRAHDEKRNYPKCKNTQKP